MVSPESQPLPIRVTPDWQVLGFTLVIALLTVFLFGMGPAFHATRLELALSLKEGRSVTAGPQRNRLSRGLIVGQVALSLMLLAGAGLFLRSLVNLMNEDTGFDKQKVLVAGIDPGAAGYQVDARLENMMGRVEEQTSSLPGTQGVSFAFSVFGGGWTMPVTVPGRPRSDNDPDVYHNIVGPQYLDVMKTPVILGRARTGATTLPHRKPPSLTRPWRKNTFPAGRQLAAPSALDPKPSGRTLK